MKELLQRSKCSIFHNIVKYMIFQRRQKALLWSKGLINRFPILWRSELLLTTIVLSIPYSSTELMTINFLNSTNLAQTTVISNSIAVQHEL